MKVFLSWSKDLSNEIAKIFKDIFEESLGITAFKSDQDIFFGEGWFNRIKNEVNESDIAIVLITKENLNIPWLNFEIGAFASKIGEKNIIPVLCDITSSDLSNHPVSNLQCTDLDWLNFLAIVKQVNTLIIPIRDEGKLNSLIARFKSDYEIKIDAALDNFKNRIKTPNITLNDLASRFSTLETMIHYGLNGGFSANYVAAAITNQGDLATKNTIDIQNQLINPILSRIATLESALNNNISNTIGVFAKTEKNEGEFNSTIISLKNEVANLNANSHFTSSQLELINSKIIELETKIKNS